MENIPDINEHLARQDAKLEQIYASVEKTRKYFLWVLIISVVAFVLPLIGLAFAIPSFLNMYLGGLQDLGL